jgi:agmatinase
MRAMQGHMAQFDPNAAASADSGIFGLPYTESESALVYLPVPWEATTSYGGGTSNGPQAILEASRQVDLFDLEVRNPYEAGLFMLAESADIRAMNEKAKAQAQKIIEAAGVIDGDAGLHEALESVNAMGAKLNDYVYAETKRLLDAGKLVALVGGDHSTPFGAFRAIGEKHPGYGILHFDAHSDTRDAYEGFAWSHASIMHNALERIPALSKLVQVGIRDLCQQEMDTIHAQGDRMSVFFDRDLQRRKFEGESWSKITADIVSRLPRQVWVSFDIDGLDPRFCPNTGTPVPGGLEFAEATYLLSAVVRSGRKIIGFDVNEVAPCSSGEDEWDANVGARLLYKLSALTLASQGKAKLL